MQCVWGCESGGVSVSVVWCIRVGIGDEGVGWNLLAPAPAPTTTAPEACVRAAATPVAMVSAEDLAAQLQWDKNERSAKYLLTQKIPDSFLMCIHSKKIVKEHNDWDAIVVEYTSKGVYVQTKLRQKFMEMRCADKDDVREFLDDLRVKQEELALVGVDIDKKDY